MPNQIGALDATVQFLRRLAPLPVEVTVFLQGNDPRTGSSNVDVSLFITDGMDIDHLARIALTFERHSRWHIERGSVHLEIGDHDHSYIHDVSLFLPSSINGPDLLARMVANEKKEVAR